MEAPTSDQRGVEHGYVTPDAVPLDLELATVGSRGVAYLLDLVIFLAVFLLLQLLQFALLGGGWLDAGVGVAGALVLAFAWQFGYPIGLETLWRGRTLGKAAVGLRVVTVEGAPVGVRHAAIRAFAAVFELLSTMGLLAVVSSFSTRRAQRLGDLAAGTIVVRERRADEAPAVYRVPVPHGGEAYVASLDVHGLDPGGYALVRETLRRAGDLRPGPRHALLVEVADRVADRVRPAPPDGVDPAWFLQAVAAAVQARTLPDHPGAHRSRR